MRPEGGADARCSPSPRTSTAGCGGWRTDRRRSGGGGTRRRPGRAMQATAGRDVAFGWAGGVEPRARRVLGGLLHPQTSRCRGWCRRLPHRGRPLLAHSNPNRAAGGDSDRSRRIPRLGGALPVARPAPHRPLAAVHPTVSRARQLAGGQRLLPSRHGALQSREPAHASARLPLACRARVRLRSGAGRRSPRTRFLRMPMPFCANSNRRSTRCEIRAGVRSGSGWPDTMHFSAADSVRRSIT